MVKQRGIQKIPSVRDCLSSEAFFNGLAEFILGGFVKGLKCRRNGNIHMHASAGDCVRHGTIEGTFFFLLDDPPQRIT